MSREKLFATNRTAKFVPRRPHRWWLWSGVLLSVLTLIGLLSTSHGRATAQDDNRHVSGAGRTIIEGGTGGTTPQPVVTTVALHADARGGDFECLALAPKATGGSGEFTENVMYVTGKVTSAEVAQRTATVRGTATVTGLGAGMNVPFTAVVVAGGPGATIRLDVSGLTFREILLEGQISVD